MNVAMVQESLSTLGSYPEWELSLEEQRIAYSATPKELNTENPSHLSAQLTYLGARQEQIAARQVLLQEIAGENDRFMPLAYRLGVIASLDITKGLPIHKDENDSMLLEFTHLSVDRSEQRVHVSRNPLERAVQIGDELDRLQHIFSKRRKVPVLMVWNHNFIPPRLNYDEVVLGEVEDPKSAFTLEAPTVEEVDGEKIVSYSIPTKLQGVKKTRVIWEDEYVQPEDKYTNPTITTLAKLVIGNSVSLSGPSALYIGRKEVNLRLAKTEKDKAEYARQMQALSRVPWSERRF